MLSEAQLRWVHPHLTRVRCSLYLVRRQETSIPCGSPLSRRPLWSSHLAARARRTPRHRLFTAAFRAVLARRKNGFRIQHKVLDKAVSLVELCLCSIHTSKGRYHLASALQSTSFPASHRYQKGFHTGFIVLSLVSLCLFQGCS